MEEPTGKARMKRGRVKDSPGTTAAPARLRPGRSGEWMEAAEVRQWAMEQLARGAGEPAPELVIDLEGLDHLDASALQVLLAMGAEQHRRGGSLRLEHVSASLERWFGYAGAADLPGFSAAIGQPTGGESRGNA